LETVDIRNKFRKVATAAAAAAASSSSSSQQPAAPLVLVAAAAAAAAEAAGHLVLVVKLSVVLKGRKYALLLALTHPPIRRWQR